MNKLNLKDRVSDWWYFEVRLRLNGLSRKFYIWTYMNFPTKDELLAWLNTDLFLPKKEDGYIYYKSEVYALYPERLKRNAQVLSKYGIGKIRGLYNKKVELHMISATGKTRGYSKLLNVGDITQLVVYHPPSQQFIPLTPRDYLYILNEKQVVEYRVTNRKYATLSPSYREEVEYIKIFNEQRGGNTLLKTLLKKGWVIKKEK